MTEHDWAPICEEDPAIMCNVCFQCQCCETPNEECPGEWVPDNPRTEQSKRLIEAWLEAKRGWNW